MSNKNFRPPDSIHADTELTLILVDYSNLLYRAWFVSREQPWIAYCKFFDMLRLCIHKSKQPGVPIGIIFAGESRNGLVRSQLFPDYKGKRSRPKNPTFAEYQKNSQKHYREAWVEYYIRKWRRSGRCHRKYRCKKMSSLLLCKKMC